jgi:hypothetical protein
LLCEHDAQAPDHRQADRAPNAALDAVRGRERDAVTGTECTAMAVSTSP